MFKGGKCFLFVCQVSGIVENFNIGIYSDTVNIINVKPCMVVLLIERYLFISLSVNLTIFQGHSNIKQFSLKSLCSYPVKLKFCWIVK